MQTPLLIIKGRLYVTQYDFWYALTINSAGAFEHEYGFVGSKMTFSIHSPSTSPYTSSVKTRINRLISSRRGQPRPVLLLKSVTLRVK